MASRPRPILNQPAPSERQRRLLTLTETMADCRQGKTLAQSRLRALVAAREAGADIPDRAIERQRGIIHEFSSMLHHLAKTTMELQLEMTP